MRLDEIFYNQPLILTDKDKTSVGELRKRKYCPVKECIKNLKDTKEVFFRQEGKRWAIAFKKDTLN